MSRIGFDFKNILLGEKKTILQIPVYVVVGLTVAVTQFATFALVLFLSNERHFLSSAAAFGIAVIVSFVLQRHVTFSKQKPRNIEKRLSFTLFVLYALINLSINQAIVYTGVDILHINAFYAQLVSMSFLATTNFVVYRFVFS